MRIILTRFVICSSERPSISSNTASLYFSEDGILSLLLNPFTDSFLVSTNLSPITNSESQPFDRLRVNSISIRCVPLKRDHPASLIQTPKSSERPSIVPHEVSREPPRWCSGSLSSKMTNVLIQPSDKPDQTPPFSSLRSNQSGESFWACNIAVIES